MYGEDLAWIQAAGFGALARGAAPEIIRRLQSASIPVRRVIDAGCGAGPLSKALVDAGFDVTGIDASSELLAIARREVPEAKFVEASIYDLPLPPCEAVIALGEPLTYHDDPARADGLVAAFFTRAASVLPSGGLLIFDLIETGEPSLSARVWKAGDDWAVLVETKEVAEARTLTLTRNIQTFRREDDLYRRGREFHRVRLFDRAEVARQLETAGFRFETAASYGAEELAPRRCAFFATRM